MEDIKKGQLCIYNFANGHITLGYANELKIGDLGKFGTTISRIVDKQSNYFISCNVEDSPSSKIVYNENDVTEVKQNDFINKKIIVDTPERNKYLQEFLFEKYDIRNITIGDFYRKYLIIKKDWDGYIRIFYLDTLEEFRDREEQEIFFNNLFPIFKENGNFKNCEVNKMNEWEIKGEVTLGCQIEEPNIQKFDKQNLKKAKEAAEEERKSYEIETAKEKYKKLMNQKDKLNRDIKEEQEKIEKLKEEIKEIDEQLKIFNTK